MDLSVIVNGVISLFLIILVGVYAAKKRIITKEINKGLTNILLKITLPCLVVSSFIFDLSDELKDNIIRCFIYSPLVLIISIVISYILLIPIKGEKKIIIQFANVVFCNGAKKCLRIFRIVLEKHEVNYQWE